jgi:lysine-N-methylase
LGQTISVTVVKPEYYDKFMCTMAACEYNCCKRGWEIVIDKSTYLKYRNVKDPIFHAKQKECVKRVRDDNVTDMRYAQFIFADGKLCPFQTEEGLCEIHRDLGEDFMCRTCRVYPRRVSKMVPEYVELSLSMSCPQVVRTALFDEKPIAYNIEAMEFKKHDPIMKSSTHPGQGTTKTN